MSGLMLLGNRQIAEQSIFLNVTLVESIKILFSRYFFDLDQRFEKE